MFFDDLGWLGELKDYEKIVLTFWFWHIFDIERRVWGEICAKKCFCSLFDGVKTASGAPGRDPGEVSGKSGGGPRTVQGKPKGIKLTPMGAKRKEKERPWAPRGWIK